MVPPAGEASRLAGGQGAAQSTSERLSSHINVAELWRNCGIFCMAFNFRYEVLETRGEVASAEGSARRLLELC